MSDPGFAKPTTIDDDNLPMMRRLLMIGAISFLTQIDLFGAQALLPSLVARFSSAPAAMGFAVNASTIGMGLAGLGVALISARLNRRIGIVVSLALLAIPTTLAGLTSDLTTFTWLRIIQGVFMSAAFTLTMAYLAENCTKEEAAGAMAAYVTGAVASNLLGRIMSAFIADAFGVTQSFLGFAALNLLGAAIAAVYLRGGVERPPATTEPPLRIWSNHLRNPQLIVAFAIGFIILFAFIGVFTYVNFILAAPPISLGPAALGLVYLVFIPALLSTPVAGAASVKFGLRRAFWASIAVSLGGVALLSIVALAPILIGLALIGVGLFFAQAAVTAFVGQAATADRAAASGLYLAAYYFGGVVGSLALGAAFSTGGWGLTLIVIALSLVVAAALGAALTLTVSPTTSNQIT